MLEGILSLLLLAASIYAIIQIVGSNATTMEKTLWIVGVLLLPVIGLIAWFFAGPADRRDDPLQQRSMRTVMLTRQPIELFKILKFAGLTDSGGAAKTAIADGQVKVNGAVETQKRKQIVAGDVIEFAGEQLTMALE